MASGRARRRRWWEILAYIALTILLAAAISIGWFSVCRVSIDLPSRYQVTPSPTL